jgi:hypothetical protein
MSNKTKRGLGILEEDDTDNTVETIHESSSTEDNNNDNNVETQGFASPTTGDFGLQKESDFITPIPNVLTDPAERVRVAVLLDTQVSVGKFITATALHGINKNNLHKELGYESFNQLVEERYQMSRRHAANYISVIESLGSGERVKELMNRNSLTKLLEVSKEIRDKNKTEDNGKVFLEIDGEQVEQSEYVNKLLAEEKVKIYEAKEQLSSKLDSIEVDNKTLASKIEKKDAEIARLKKNLDAFSKTKGLSPELIILANNNKEAEAKITNAVNAFSEQMDILEKTIPYEIRNPKLATDIQTTLIVMRGRLRALEENWTDHLLLIEAKSEDKN